MQDTEDECECDRWKADADPMLITHEYHGVMVAMDTVQSRTSEDGGSGCNARRVCAAWCELRILSLNLSE